MKLIITSIILSILFICSITLVSAAGGGATVPVSTVSLTEQGNDYSMKPGRLIFEFNKEWYAIQLRRLKDESANFIIMNLDENKLEDITAYEITETEFNLNPKENREIDLNGDNVNDVIIELDEIISNSGSVRSASFFIRKLGNVVPISNEKENAKNIEIIGEENKEETMTEDSEGILNEGSQEVIITNLAGGNEEKITLIETQIVKEETDLTFFQKIISWFKRLF